jgi:hypothetical protein
LHILPRASLTAILLSIPREYLGLQTCVVMTNLIITNFLSGLALKCGPPNLCLLGSWDLGTSYHIQNNRHFTYFHKLLLAWRVSCSNHMQRTRLAKELLSTPLGFCNHLWHWYQPALKYSVDCFGHLPQKRKTWVPLARNLIHWHIIARKVKYLSYHAPIETMKFHNDINILCCDD